MSSIVRCDCAGYSTSGLGKIFELVCRPNICIVFEQVLGWLVMVKAMKSGDNTDKKFICERERGKEK